MMSVLSASRKLYNGGLETIQSYGISVFAPPEDMVKALPPAHFKFLGELESILEAAQPPNSDAEDPQTNLR